MTNRLAGKVAIVTGAGSGLGRAIALAFAQEDAKVVLADFNIDAIEEVSKEIQAGGGISLTIPTDMTQLDEVSNLIKTTVSTYGRVDVLVNNAAIMDNFRTIITTSPDLWNKVIAVNLTGPFFACHEAVDVMKDQEAGGVIINNASVAGMFGAHGGVSYVASKHGLIGLTRNIAATYGRFGKIRVNAIAPCAVDTNIGTTVTGPDSTGTQAIAAVGAQEAPMGQPEDIAAVAVFLASDESKFVNGDVITADGGWTAS